MAKRNALSVRKEAEVVETRGPGQPTKYREEFCEKLCLHMADGKSYESFGPKVGVDRSILYDWEKAHPMWKAAKALARDLCLAWWEEQGREGLWDQTEYEDGKPIRCKKLNGTVWIFNMKNLHKWRDKQPDEADTLNINLQLADRVAKARARIGEKK